MTGDAALLERSADACRRIKTDIARVVVGHDEVVDAILVTLLARGHALLVGVPGLAKTLLVASIAQTLDLAFGRVQFTPDLLPADITGTDVLSDVEEAGRIRQRIGFDGFLMSDDIGMEALAGDHGERAAACVAAGCDVALHCDGKMENMLLVAKAVPALSQEAEARLSRAMAMTFTPEDGMDFAAAVEKRDALLALA